MPITRKRLSISIDKLKDNIPSRKKRVTRSTFGSTVDIPIVLDSSSDSENSDTSFGEMDKLDQVLTNGRIIGAQKRRSMGISTVRKPKDEKSTSLPEPKKQNEQKTESKSALNSGDETKTEVSTVAPENSKIAAKIDGSENLIDENKKDEKVEKVEKEEEPEKINKTPISKAETEKDIDTPCTTPSLASTDENRPLEPPAAFKKEDIKNAILGNKKLNGKANSALSKKADDYFNNRKPITSKSDKNGKNGTIDHHTSKPSVENNNSKIGEVVKIPSDTALFRKLFPLKNNGSNKNVSAFVNNKENTNPLLNASNVFVRAHANSQKPKDEKPIIFDPKTQKSYKDTYSVACISCQKTGRGEYCNRQQPCDICVGKRLRKCTYPQDAKIVIPARLVKKTRSRSSKYGLNNSSRKHRSFIVESDEESDNSDMGKSGSGASKKETSSQINSILKRVDTITKSKAENSDSDSEAETDKEHQNRSSSDSSESHIEGSKSVNKSRNSELRNLKVNVNIRNTVKKSSADQGPSSQKVQKSNTVRNKSTRQTTRSRKSYNDFEDEDEDDFDSVADSEDNSSESMDDKDDDVYSEYEYSSRGRRNGNRKLAQSGVNEPQVDFNKAQRILKELAFEKREIDNIYMTSRQKRSATKENYVLPSDDDDDDESGLSIEQKGYAAAEARNEQVILSEDEQEKRILRGEIDLNYIESLRNEREKHKHAYSSDSLTSSDSE